MKKILALFLCCMMLTALSVPAMAAGLTVGRPPVKKTVPSPNYIPMPEGSEELLTNTSFEERTEGGGVRGWSASAGGWTEQNEKVRVSEENAHDGSVCVNISGSGNPYVTQQIYSDFKKGEVYQLSTWVRIPEQGAQGFKCEWYDESSSYLGGHNTESYATPTGDTWVQHVYMMEIPQNCASIYFLVRNFSGSGSIFVDSVSFYRISQPAKVFLEAENIFFYTDDAAKGQKGTIEALVNSEVYEELEDSTVSFRLKDGNTVLDEKTKVVPENAKAYYEFRASLLKEEWKAYTVEVSVIGADGTVQVKAERPVYKYPRPTYLNEKGKIVLPDGKELNPTLWYHVDPSDYGRLVAAGGTVVQTRWEDYERIKFCLDEAEKVGLKVMAALYRDMKPAAHPDNVENTTEIITKLKDHPALLGYMVMDEPSSKFANRLEFFEESYKLIRTLDPDHIVYLVEHNPGYYDTFRKYVDVLAIDPYPGIVSGGAWIDHVHNYATRALSVTEYAKPVWSINQATGYEYLVPDEAAIRNMFYSALFAGATAVGHYSWYDKTQWMGGKAFYETENLEGMTNVYSNGDADTAYAHFVDRAYPIFKEQETDDYFLSSFVRGGDVYMYLINRGAEVVNVSVPLTSDGGAVSIGDYSASIVYGDTNVNSVRLGSGNLDFAIDGNAAYLLKITPSSPVDFSALKTTKYRDLYVTPWAAEAIREVESRGIVNDASTTSFAPERNITRGELAYFLIRTLGLTAEATESFADVEADAFYAKELAVGKALGILNGVGDNKYNPEAEISRQDLMTIIARGMQLSGAGADLSVFSDNAQIADYAKDAVGAMVLSGLVKGNADGTMNPLGNTTRAEAAVIMQRILTK